MSAALTWVNLALRRLMQLGVVLAVGYWSYHASQRVLAKAVLGVLAPVLVFGFWEMVDSAAWRKRCACCKSWSSPGWPPWRWSWPACRPWVGPWR